MEQAAIPDNDGMIIKLNNNQPVELADYTLSMLAVSNEYSRMLARRYGSKTSDAVKVYVKEVRSGSIITEIAAATAGVLPAILPHIEHVSSLMEYAKSLKESIDFFSGKSADAAPPGDLDRQSLNNLSRIIEPVAKDSGGEMTFVTNNVYNGPVYQFGIDSMQANAVQNGINRLLDSKEIPVTGPHNKVLLHLHQARGTIGGNAIDRGIIESISRAPVRLIMDESVKVSIVQGEENPFRMAYLVDVDVETVSGKPQLYKILNLWQKIPIEFLDDRPLPLE